MTNDKRIQEGEGETMFIIVVTSKVSESSYCHPVITYSQENCDELIKLLTDRSGKWDTFKAYSII